MAVFKNISGALLILDGPGFERVPSLDPNETFESNDLGWRTEFGSAFFSRYVDAGLLEHVSGALTAYTDMVPSGQKLVNAT